MNRLSAVRSVTIAALTGALLLGASACGSGNQEPSAENFCATLNNDAAKLSDATTKLRALADSSGATKSVSDMASAAKSFIDLANIYEELSAVAPPQVKADVETIRTTFDGISADAGADTTKLAAQARDALNSLRNSGEVQRLRDYAQQQCGVTLG
ncbi:MAG: hypothetical protein Q4G51_10125 [Dermatophilus congolensis]|nr:hypothetical protein [Dermatophilus congolensis]